MTIFDFANLLADCQLIILVGGLLIGIYCYKKNDIVTRYLWGYLILMLGAEVLSYILGFVFKVSNHIVMPIYSLVELVFFYCFYKRFLFKKLPGYLMICFFAALFYILFEIFYNFIYTYVSIKNYQPYAKVADNFFIILMSFGFLYEKMNNYDESKWDYFRLNIMILSFFTLNTIIFLPFNFLVNETTGLKFYFWMANLVLLFTQYGYIIFEIITNDKNKKVKSV
jgi:hypothetical protein